MLVELRPLESITPYDKNPRHNDAAVGTSRQGAPLLSTQKIPFSIARWSLHFPPRRCRGINGSIRAHASSVSSYRLPIVGLLADDHHDRLPPKAPGLTGAERRAVHAPNA